MYVYARCNVLVQDLGIRCLVHVYWGGGQGVGELPNSRGWSIIYHHTTKLWRAHEVIEDMRFVSQTLKYQVPLPHLVGQRSFVWLYRAGHGRAEFPVYIEVNT